MHRRHVTLNSLAEGQHRGRTGFGSLKQRALARPNPAIAGEEDTSMCTVHHSSGDVLSDEERRAKKGKKWKDNPEMKSKGSRPRNLYPAYLWLFFVRYAYADLGENKLTRQEHEAKLSMVMSMKHHPTCALVLAPSLIVSRDNERDHEHDAE